MTFTRRLLLAWYVLVGKETNYVHESVHQQLLKDTVFLRNQAMQMKHEAENRLANTNASLARLCFYLRTKPVTIDEVVAFLKENNLWDWSLEDECGVEHQ